MNTKDLVYKMVTELTHNYKKYNDGCGDVNYDLLALIVGSKLRLMDRNALEAPEWIWDAAILAVTAYNKDKNQNRNIKNK